LFLLVPARERKLTSSSCRYEELSLSYRAREKVPWCRYEELSLSYRAREKVQGTFSLLVPGERLSFVSPRTGTGEKTYFLVVPVRGTFPLVPGERESTVVPVRGTFSLVPGERESTRNFLSARTGREIKFCFSSYRHGRENLLPRRAGTRNFLSRTGRERKYEELCLCSYRARDQILFLLVPTRERKLSSSSCRYEELSLSYRAREKVRGTFCSYRARDQVLFLLVPARERKLTSSSCRYEELFLPCTGTRNFVSARTGREIKSCFSSYRHGRENLVSRRAGTRNFLSLVPLRGTLSLLVPGERLSFVSPRTGTGEKT
jgi:hypothetical protein